MKTAKVIIVIAVTSTLLSKSSYADILVEDFSTGLSSNLWQINMPEGYNPWTVSVHEEQLKISKPADPDGPNNYTGAGISSKFTLRGDFEVTFDYDLPIWPHPGLGYNVAAADFLDESSGVYYCAQRHTLNGNSTVGDPWECTHFRRIGPGTNELIGTGDGPYMRGTFKFIRHGNIMSCYLTPYGQDTIYLGSKTDYAFGGDVKLRFNAAQNVRPTGYRSFSELDVRYDNIVIIADTIIPEPATLPLLGLSGILLRRR